MADLSASIAAYVKTIHDSYVWPTLSPPPDSVDRGKPAVPLRSGKIVFYQRLLARMYLDSLSLFDPERRPCTRPSHCQEDELCIDGECVPVPGPGTGQSLDARPCRKNSDCQQDELCIDGVCVPVPHTFGGLRPCRKNSDCQQDELCIDGVCTPVPYGIEFDPTAGVSIDTSVELSIQAYFGRIHAVLVKGLEANPAKLLAVRELLMKASADAGKAALPRESRPRKCDEDHDCEEGYECVNGVCVKSPFPLKIKPVAFSKPW